MKLSQTLLVPIFFVTSLSLVGCVPPHNGGPSYDPYDSRYDSNYDSYQNRRDWERARDERERLRREREHAEDERERLEDERRRLERDRRRLSAPPPPPPPTHYSCPSGFRSTNDKCSDKERKKGCRDIKLPNGERCIKR